jgi:FtsP/CotA-like multicopper oxidase with cupredoxin domain
LRIRRCAVELGAGHLITTTTYDGRFPGPPLRLTVGRPTIIDVSNETDLSERIHWHGQESVEESAVPARSTRRFEFVPTRSGPSFYHSDVIAAADLGAGLYSGQAGPLLLAGCEEPGRFDREVVLVVKEFMPHLRRTRHGCEVGYEVFTINGRMLGHGEPVRVRARERVLFHVLNASATETRTLALPGHVFGVTALDGSPAPTPARVSTLRLSPAERVSAIVEMNQPGVWILGELADEDRNRGMGIVVEYAGRAGAPAWLAQAATEWDYTRFGASRIVEPARIVDIVFARSHAARGGFSRWTVNGGVFSFDQPQPIARLRSGERYRFRMQNASDELCPVQLQYHRLELATVAGRPAGGILKDVVAIDARQQVEVEFVARNVGPALLQSTRRLYRDFGLMARVEIV